MGELIAEMGSCFLATELGIPNAENLPNHASYLEHWLKAMRNDHRFIFQAPSAGQQGGRLHLELLPCRSPSRKKFQRDLPHEMERWLVAAAPSRSDTN